MGIYLDNAATTKVDQRVLDEMLPYFTEDYGNASSIYALGSKSKEAIQVARERVANALGCLPKEVFFTAGGTESDNWAIHGILEGYKEKGKHIITTQIEHHAILETCEDLEKKGYEVTYLPVDKYGMIQIEDLKKAIRPDTVLITIMFANNEIGTIQPIEEVGAIAREKGIVFHTDAVQAVGHIPIDVKKMNIDLLSLSGHKLHGPKGIGALYVRKGVKLRRFIHGGAQEAKKRAGTENVPGIVGLGKAIEICTQEMAEETKRLEAIRDRIIQGVLEAVPHSFLNGHPTKRLPGNANVSFEFIEGESILLLLDMKGIAASSGSACTSGSLDPSHVLMAIGLPHEKAHGSVRMTLGRFNTMEDAETLIQEIGPIVERLRSMSPLYEEYLKTKEEEACIAKK